LTQLNVNIIETTYLYALQDMHKMKQGFNFIIDR
jgi:hypothetical protein